MVLALCLFLGVWLLLAIVNQWGEAVQRKLSRFDPCHLVPRFTFFAPNPGRTDYHLFYRSATADDHFTDWLEYAPAESRSLITALWNPGKRFRKSLTDIARVFITWQGPSEPDGHDRARILLSLPYLALLNVIASIPCETGTVARQFAILQSTGFLPDKPLTVLFRSELHRVDGR